MPLKDLAIWLGKCAGVTLTHAAKIEEHTVALPNLGNAYMRQPRPMTISTAKNNS